MHEVLQKAIKMVNFIKSKPLNERLFKKLCSEMVADYQQLLLHTEIRWLSRGRVLARLYELRSEVQTFFENHDGDKHFLPFITDAAWTARLAYLSDFYGKVNALNLSLQGREIYLIHATSKIEAFARKLTFWKSLVMSGNPECFESLNDFVSSCNYSIDLVKHDIIDHLTAVECGFASYFKTGIDTEKSSWIINPFSINSTSALPVSLHEELIDLSADISLKTEFQNSSLPQFWIKRATEYPALSLSATKILLPFASTYLCEGELIFHVFDK